MKTFLTFFMPLSLFGMSALFASKGYANHLGGDSIATNQCIVAMILSFGSGIIILVFFTSKEPAEVIPEPKPDEKEDRKNP